MATSEFHVENHYKVDHRSPLRWVLSHASRHWGMITIAIIGAFGNAALAGAVPVLIGIGFDAVAGQANPNYDTLLWAALAIVGSQLLRAVLQLGRNFGSEAIGQRLERDVRDELYVSLLGKSMTFHALQPVGDTMARATNDVREVNLMLNPGINLVLGSAMFLLIPLIFAPAYHPSLLITPVLFIIGYVLALRQFLSELNPITERSRLAFGEMNSRLAEAIDGIETVKGAAQETSEIEEFTRRAAEFRDAFIHQGRVEARYIPLLLLGLAFAGAFFHAALLYQAGLLAIGDIVAYVGLISLFGFPTFISLFAYAQVSLGMASARRILALILTKTELDENSAGHTANIRGEITFDHVSFGYTPDKPVLENLNFTIPPGQTVAIVGQTGAGKTTLAKLINRLYDTTAGHIRIDGIDVRDWQLERLRQQISIIEQDIFLFSRSIADNIAFGVEGATREQVIEAARLAQAHDFILQFKDGYDTLVGERGVTLSGGQRQRIAIARAFLTRPAILILDDSTSAIDSATEDQIQRAIQRIARQQTTLLITHRLSQIRWADQIIVLKQGRIVAMGSHAELYATTDAYRRIFDRYERG